MYPFPKTKIRKLVCIGIYKKAVLYRIKPRYFLTSLSVEKSTKKSARIGGDYKGNLFRITDNLMKRSYSLQLVRAYSSILHPTR